MQDAFLFVLGCHFGVSEEVKSQLMLAQEGAFHRLGASDPAWWAALSTTLPSHGSGRPEVPFQDVADKADVFPPPSMSFLRASLKPLTTTVPSRRAFATTPVIMADKQQWLCILPDGAGMLEKRMEVRPYVEME